MKRTRYNIAMALVLAACQGYAQDSLFVNQTINTDTIVVDSVIEADKKIKISLLGNYYGQDGERGATNGGVSSQELYSYTKEANIFLPLSKRVDFKLNTGLDFFTAASYLDIDKYKTSASSGNSGVSVDETRKYSSFGLDIASKNKSFKVSPLYAFSNEYDVRSKTFGLSTSYKNPVNASVITAKATFITDEWLLIYPGEFRTSTTADGSTGASDKGTKLEPNVTKIYLGEKTGVKDGKIYNIDHRKTASIGANYAFNINKRMNSLLGLDLISQNGLLSTPFYRVYFRDGITDEYFKTVAVEKLPDERLKVALYGKYNYYINPLMILRTGARIYTDNWGLSSLTLDVATAIKIKPWVSLMPFYRFHTQSSAKYFAGYGRHELNDEFYTSDFDLAALYSNKVGASVRLVPFKPLLGIKSFDFRYATYRRSDGLTANSISAELSIEMQKIIKNKK